MRDALAFWDQFFFGPVDLLPLGLFRFMLGGTLLLMNILRLPDLKFYFTQDGLVPPEQAFEIIPEFFRPPMTWFPWDPFWTLALFGALLVALFCLTVGLGGRWAALVSLILQLAFFHRNVSIIYGVDFVSNYFLLGLVFAENDRCFSIRSLWSRGRRAVSPVSSLFSTVGVRLVQLQLCIIYAYTGLEKLKGQRWWDGTAVWAVIGNDQIMMFDASWLKEAPLLIGLMTFSTVLFEIYFPVLIWLKRFRYWLIAYGWVLHAMIALIMGLFFFSGAMMAAYLLFANPDWLRERFKSVLPARFLAP